MLATLFLAILAIVAIVGFIFPITYGWSGGGLARRTRAAGWAGTALFVLLLLFTTVTSVQANSIGVLTTGGQTADRTLSPGYTLKAPWQKVTEVDGTVQVNEFVGKDCIKVRIGDGSQSCLSVTVRSRVNPEKANTVYGDYRKAKVKNAKGEDEVSDDPTVNVIRALVTTPSKSAAQAVLSKYNPVASLETVGGADAAKASKLSFAPDYDAIATAFAAQLRERIGSNKLVELDAVNVSYVSLSDSTQKKLNDFIAAVGDTRIASQKRSTAAEEAAANRALSASVSNDPNVLVSKCLDTFDQMVETKQKVPAGFSCFQGGSPALVVPRG